MATRLVAQVAVEQTTFHFDRLYSYDADAVSSRIQVGCRVLVPFGKGNRLRQGLVMALENEVVCDTPFKAVTEVLDETPLLNQELLDLAIFLKDRTFCTLFDAVRAMLPAGLCMYVKPLYKPVLSQEESDFSSLTDEETAVYRLACTLIKKHPDGVAAEVLLRGSGLQSHTQLPEKLVKKGWLLREEDAFRRGGDATLRMLRLTASVEQTEELADALKCTKKQRAVLSLLTMAGAASVKEVCYLTGVTPAVATALVKKGFVEFFEQERLRSPLELSAVPRPIPIVLNEEQQGAFEELSAIYRREEAACALLHGVTGSGKTSVYISLADTVLADGKQVLVLVPEISLTPQTMQLFFRRYGSKVAVLHSGLSMGERMDEWKRIRRGDARLVVGTRSAVFAPFSDLGLIVMDEEQEHAYKSESTPRYHARDVAKFRCVKHKALLLLTSATPSIESYYAALTGRYSLHTLSSRYGEAALPHVQTVDMRVDTAQSDLLSNALIGALDDCLARGKQAVLLLNRRGYQTMVSCRSCGRVMTCPSCSISMTYHRANGQMVCHYCGHQQPPVHHCPDCGSDAIRYSGQGTQRVEEELERLFDGIRILRMDADAAASRYTYEQKFRAFAAGEYDVLIGTQMVAKGLDFPDVTLAAVLSADRSLYEGDFRSYETTFALLTQVVGRAGRRDNEGKALIQTTVPDHYVIQLAAQQDFTAFYQTEIEARRMMKYPPFADLCQFGFVGNDEQTVRKAALLFVSLLQQLAQTPPYQQIPLIVLDPTPATVIRAAGKFRYKVLTKLKNTAVTRAFIAEALKQFSNQQELRNVSVFADMNPLTIL